MLICHAGKPVLTENSTKFFDAFKWKRRQYELDEYIEVQLNNTKRSGKSSKLAPGATVAQIHCLWEDDEGEHMELRILFRYGDHIFNDPLFGMLFCSFGFFDRFKPTGCQTRCWGRSAYIGL
jgi:hypothetical protein